MDGEAEILENAAEAEQVEEEAAGGGDSDGELAPPIESRFLYVDVAAQRAKQLRRGAVPKLDEPARDAGADGVAAPGRKLERIAMREVDGGKVHYMLPAAARKE